MSLLNNEPYVYQDLFNEAIVNGNIVNTGVIDATNVNISSGLNLAYISSSILEADGSGNIVGVKLTDGQVLVGSTNNPPVASTITGTTKQILVTNRAGSITLSTPQNISPSDSPTFNSISLGTTPNLITLDVATTAPYTYTITGSPFANDIVVSNNTLIITNTPSIGEILIAGGATNASFQDPFPWSIAQGGTASSTALTNGKVITSNSGSIVESNINTSALVTDTAESLVITNTGTSGQVLISSGSANASWQTSGGDLLNTKGQLLTYSTNQTAFNVGTNGAYLQANSSTTTGLNWQIPFGQQIIVDSVNGSDSTGNLTGSPYASLAGALSGLGSGTGYTIILYPGTLSNLNPLTLPSGNSIVGNNKQLCVIKGTSTTGMTLLTLGTGCYVANLTVLISEAHNHGYQGIFFNDTGSTQVDNCIVQVNNSGASSAGTYSTYAINSSSTTQPDLTYSNLLNCQIICETVGNGSGSCINFTGSNGGFNITQCTMEVTSAGGSLIPTAVITSGSSAQIQLSDCHITANTLSLISNSGSVINNDINFNNSEILNSGALNVLSTTASTSLTTGSIINAGGLGCTGDIWTPGINLTGIINPPSILNYYEQNTETITWSTSPIITSNPTTVFNITGIGNIIVLGWPDIGSATSSGTATIFTSSTALTSRWRPANNVNFCCMGENNAIDTQITMEVSTAGIIKFSINYANFTASATTAVWGGSVTYQT